MQKLSDGNFERQSLRAHLIGGRRGLGKDAHFGSKLYCDIRGFDFKDRSRARLYICCAFLPSIRIGTVASTGHISWVNDERHLALMIPQEGSIAVTMNAQTVSAGPGEIVFVGPGERIVDVSFDHLGAVALIPFALFNSRFEEAATDRILFADGMHTTTRGPRLGQAIRRHVHAMIDEIETTNILADVPAIAASAERFLGDMVAQRLAEPDTGMHLVSTKGSGPWYLREAERLIRTRANEPISIAALAAEIGISVRALQSAFREHRGTTPQAFILARRLDLLRSRLIDPSFNETVTNAMLDCGISHVGRYASYYKLHFGETPRDTMRRAQDASCLRQTR